MNYFYNACADPIFFLGTGVRVIFEFARGIQGIFSEILLLVFEFKKIKFSSGGGCSRSAHVMSEPYILVVMGCFVFNLKMLPATHTLNIYEY